MAKITLRARVEPVEESEIHMGWVRISEELRGGIPNGAYVKLSANERDVFCQVRGTPRSSGLVKMSEWYRNQLGWSEPPSGEVDMEIKSVDFDGKIQALLTHPDDVVKTAVTLGLVSVVLGAIGVVLGVIGLVLGLLGFFMS